MQSTATKENKKDSFIKAGSTENQISIQYKAFLLLGMIAFGTLNTITYKFQNSTIVYQPGYPLDDHERKFFHPYMQAVAMFFGEFLCYFIFIAYKLLKPKQYQQELLEGIQKGLDSNVNYLELAIPAFFDLCTSTLQHVALVWMSASVYQMMRGGVILIVAFGSKLFLGKQYIPQQWLGCFLVLIGISLVGIQSMILQGNTDTSGDSQFLALLLIFISWFTDGVRYIYEEKLFRKYCLNPLQLVGIEGMYGLFIYSIMIPILCNSNCPFQDKDCVFNNYGQPRFESFQDYFYEMTQTAQLTFWCILGIFSILFFNILGVTTTKNLSALVRSLTDITRTSFVWIICLILTWTGVKNWENTSWIAIVCQLLGFMVMVTGNLTYQLIIKLEWFNKFADRKRIQQQVKEQQEALEELKTQQQISQNKDDLQESENENKLNESLIYHE